MKDFPARYSLGKWRDLTGGSSSESFVPQEGRHPDRMMGQAGREPTRVSIGDLPAFSPRAGYSLVEILVVVGVIAILAALASVSFSGVFQSAREEAATANLSRLNRAVMSYSHAASELTNTPNVGISDEQAVFSNLQARDAAIPGSPFLEAHYSAVESSDATVFRGRWNGYTFELLKPGTTGTGVDLTELQ